MTLAALASVAPFLTALPAGTPVNVNTAPPEVLAAVFGNAGNDIAAAIVAARAQRPFTTIADFRARLPQGAVSPDDASLAVRSDYFLVSVEARQGTTIARARALLHRSGAAARGPRSSGRSSSEARAACDGPARGRIAASARASLVEYN